MRTLIVGLVCIAAIEGKPFSDNMENLGGFKYPGGSNPEHLMEGNEPYNMNGMGNRGGITVDREDRPADGGYGSTSQGGINPMNQASPWQSMMGDNNPYHGQGSQMRGEGQPTDGGYESAPHGGSNPTNPASQYSSPFQGLMNDDNASFLGQSGKTRREGQPAEGGAGFGPQGGSNPMNQASQTSSPWQNLMGGMGGNTPYPSQSSQSRREGQPADGGAGFGPQGGSNPMNPASQYSSPFQGMMNDNNRPFPSQSSQARREGQPADGGAGFGPQGGSNPMNQASQASSPWQNLMGDMGGNAPFPSQSGQSRREGQPADGGAGLGPQGGSNPMNPASPYSSPIQGMMNEDNNMPFPSQGSQMRRDGQPAEGSSGLGPQGGVNPMNQASQWQNMFNGGLPGMGGNTPFPGQSSLTKKEGQPAEGGAGLGPQGGGNPMNQASSPWQNLMGGGAGMGMGSRSRKPRPRAGMNSDSQMAELTQLQDMMSGMNNNFPPSN